MTNPSPTQSFIHHIIFLLSDQRDNKKTFSVVLMIFGGVVDSSQLCYSDQIKQMSQFETISSQTHTLINYNAANDHILHRLCRTSRLPDSQEEPLKKFHQYFGKVQPSLYQELKSIFQNSSFEEPSDQQPDYHVQGVMLGTRSRQLRPRFRKELSPIGNQFTIESIQTRNIYRKAKLNRLIDCSQALQEDIPQQQVQALLRESDSLVTQLHSTLTTKRAPRHGSLGSTQKSFRVTKTTSSIDKDSFLAILNPTNRERFTMADLNQAICMLHNIEVQLSPGISYFNVFIEEGNNSQLLKTLVRRRSGWRVVELPAVANLIWTQFYRRGVLKQRLRKREKSETEEDKEKMVLRADNAKRLRLISSDKRYEMRGSEISPNRSVQECFAEQIRKLVPPCDVQEVAKMKRSTMKQAKPMQITHNVLVHNHFPFNSCISDKKNLLLHLTRYLKTKNKNVFEVVPESFELTDLTHPIVNTLQQGQHGTKQHWIIKPGENSNRGRGITIVHTSQQALAELKRRLAQEQQSENIPQRESIPQRRKRRSVILQRYIMPLLYCGRKFDIRSYMLVTYLNGQLRMYCYQECYIRTSSKSFDIDSPNRLVHLTNDAVQSHSPDYGKFEEGNKVAEPAFAKFIDEEHKRKYPASNGVWQSLKSQMQSKCIDVMEASYESLLRGVQRAGQEGAQENYYFQLFGMDFMVDENFGLWLIEVNTNPAITHDCSRVLNHLIPRMLDNAFAIAVEPIMRPLRLQELPFSNLFTAVFKKVIG